MDADIVLTAKICKGLANQFWSEIELPMFAHTIGDNDSIYLRSTPFVRFPKHWKKHICDCAN
jgi:hypothetical protein